MEATEDYIQLLTSALSNHTGIKISVGKNWSASAEKKRLNFNMEDLKYIPFDVVRGLLLHEIGHLKYTGKTKRTAPIKKYGDEKMHFIYNAFEDMRIERQLVLEYGDFARGSLYTQDYYCVMEFLQKANSNFSETSKLFQFLWLCLLKYYCNINNDLYTELNIDLSMTKPPVGINFDPIVIERHIKFCSEIRNIIYNSGNANSVAYLQKILDSRLVPIIEDFLKDDKKDDKTPPPKGGGGNPPPGSNPPPKGDGGNKPNPQEIEMVSHKVLKNILERLLQGNKNEGLQTNDVQKLTEAEARALIRPYSSVLSQRLRDVLQEQSAIKYRGLHLSGRLLGKDAYKVMLPNENRIFSKKTTPDTPMYSIYLCLDKSSSMRGTKSTYAFLGACLLKDTCEQLRFKIKILAYNSRAEFLDKLDDYQDVSGSTYDEKALELVNTVINPSEKSIVFVVTDGDTSRSEASSKIQKTLVRKNALIYGVGIGTGRGCDYIEKCIKENYENAVYVPRVEDLPKKLIEIMHKIIHR